MSITRNREISQFGSFLYIDDDAQSIGITTTTSQFVGIGTTIPTSKIDVIGDVKVSGVVTATTFYGDLSGTSTLSSGITSTSSLNTSGIVTASAFYVGAIPLINPQLQSWLLGESDAVYKETGNVGIGTSVPSERLSVVGNVSASRFISTVSTGTSPFTVSSTTLVSNLNADYLGGKLPPSGDIVGTSDTQTLTSKTLISANLTTPIVGSSGATFAGTSGSTVLLASATASGSLTLPAETGTLISTGSGPVITSSLIVDGTITNSDISTSASIAISKLAASTISGISLGNNLSDLSFSSYLTSGGSYNGSAARTVSVNASTSGVNNVVARDGSGNFSAGTISASLSGNSTTSTRLATARDINGVAFDGSADITITASTTAALSLGTYLSYNSGSTFNGSTARTINLNASTSGTSNVVARDASGNFSAGTITCVDLNSTSDINLKENIRPFENALGTINEINGVHFNWKNNSKKSVGVIAQEIEKVLPELVSDAEGFKSVNYNGLVGVLIQAIKDLSSEVEELRKKIEQ